MKSWHIQEPAPEQITRLSQAAAISPLLARLLINRRVTEAADAHAFLHQGLQDLPDPFGLLGMKEATGRIIRAITQGEKICIYGDYDVDGTVSCAMLLWFFQLIGTPVEFYIPHRTREGYSLNTAALDRLRGSGISVIITVDNGIAALAGARHARALGLDLIITDHHLPQKELPPALAIINPHQPGCSFGHTELCGAGVAFTLLMALRAKLREAGYFSARKEPNLKIFLDLVALATVADIVPLKGINRIIVRAGLEQMTRTSWVGLKALMEVTGVGNEISTTDLGFRLGPRINACGRLYDAAIGVKLLTARDAAEALPLARRLDEANRERQAVEEGILAQARGLLADAARAGDAIAHVLYHPDWHPGVVGIVASRLVDTFYRPVILFGRDGEYLKGSARSIPGLHLMEALTECGKHLLKFGGHRQAAGMSLRPEQLSAFRTDFAAACRTRLAAEALIPRLPIDARLKPSHINDTLFAEIHQLAPFGAGNREPTFCLEAVDTEGMRIVGRNHLKFSVRDGSRRLGAIGFAMGGAAPQPGAAINLAFALRKNTYQGHTALQLHLKDMKVTG